MAQPSEPPPTANPGFCPKPGEEPTPVTRPAPGQLLLDRMAHVDEMLKAHANSEQASAAFLSAYERLVADGDVSPTLEALSAAPDRMLDDGTDSVVDVLLRAGLQRLRDDPERTDDLARRAEVLAPREVSALIERGLAARARHRPDEVLAQFRDALALLPNDPSLAWEVANDLRDTQHLDALESVLRTYVHAKPNDVSAAQWLARVGVQREIQGHYPVREAGGISVSYSPEIFSDDDAEALRREVEKDLDDAARLTGTERRRELSVVVYPGRAELLAVSCVNAWTAALYDGVLRVVAHPELPGKVSHREVRHESMHAQLAPLVHNAPFWFHEGLACYFEGDPRPDLRHAQLMMVRNHTFIPFESLSGSFAPFTGGGDATLAYAQSLGMVQWLASLGGNEAVPEAVRALQQEHQVDLLAHASGRDHIAERDLLDFLAR